MEKVKSKRRTNNTQKTEKKTFGVGLQVTVLHSTFSFLPFPSLSLSWPFTHSFPFPFITHPFSNVTLPLPYTSFLHFPHPSSPSLPSPQQTRQKHQNQKQTPLQPDNLYSPPLSSPFPSLSLLNIPFLPNKYNPFLIHHWDTSITLSPSCSKPNRNSGSSSVSLRLHCFHRTQSPQTVPLIRDDSITPRP